MVLNNSSTGDDCVIQGPLKKYSNILNIIMFRQYWK